MGINRLCAGRSKFHSGRPKELGWAANDFQGEEVFETHKQVRLGGKAPRGGAAATRAEATEIVRRTVRTEARGDV